MLLEELELSSDTLGAPVEWPEFPPAAAGSQNAFKSPGIQNLEIGVV